MIGFILGSISYHKIIISSYLAVLSGIWTCYNNFNKGISNINYIQFLLSFRRLAHLFSSSVRLARIYSFPSFIASSSLASRVSDWISGLKYVKPS